MSEQPTVPVSPAVGYLTEETGKPSYTRVSSAWCFAFFAAFAAVSIWLDYVGKTAAADRADTFAFYCFVGATVPNLLRRIIPQLLGRFGLPASQSAISNPQSAIR